MIPPRFDPGTTSPGEAEVFRRIQHDPDTRDWIVIHSLDITRHRRQIEGEIDFLIFIPGLGVLDLEVKGHYSAHRDADGMWHLGGDPPTHKSPFKQASENRHSVQAELVHKRPEFSRVLFWSAVCFPFTNLGSPEGGRPTHREWHPWQLIEKREFERDPISTLVRAVLESAARHVRATPAGKWFDPTVSLPTKKQCTDMASFFRPRYEVFESPAERARERTGELKRFTEDQFVVLDAMADNDRVIFQGPAGTGKTLLCIESARREALAGRRALLCCYNRLLGRWLSRETQPLGGVRAGTLHSYMLETAGLAAPLEPTSEFWAHELPERSLEQLLEMGEQFDTVIVDEAQDLLTDAYLDVLDASLVGGLSGGRWQLFGDFERQAIYGSGARPLNSILESRRLHVTKYPLTSNCRNTPRIASLVGLLAGLDHDYHRVLRPDNGIEPEPRFFQSAKSQPKLLARVLDELKGEGYAEDEIVILSPLASGACSDALPRDGWGARIRETTIPPTGIQKSTIHAFKGLEAPAVVVTDIDTVGTEEADALLYVAITRATDRLVLLINEAAKADLARLLTGKAREVQL